MSLYDDVDTKQVSEWSSGINKLMPQPALNKIQQPKKPNLLTPVVSLKPKIVDEVKPKEIIKPRIIQSQPLTPIIPQNSQSSEFDEFLAIQDEYNPAIPNEYEKIVKERREKNKKEDRKRHRSQSPRKSGFGKRRSSEDEEFRPSMNQSSRAGTAIAPPKSLQEGSTIIDIPNISAQYGASAVAAKIMAKYGFKDGQGLGKQEQGISTALQVEKTSKRGGRIINEKEMKEVPSVPAQSAQPSTQGAVLPSEQTITEMLKNPSKVILLRNMVGPGEVDDELEPEVKDECTTKYGEVITVHIMEMPNQIPEETVRIFVEFARLECAIKALLDLNGRFFGGRQVRCRFYSSEKYENFIFDQ
ncbi:splicing factor 45 [Chironomus tepperi]|uniref:splicing factor 45 n=1 Tax=Chironomus tepperi TaxID=113505 RepID=UPI00391F5665